ncbi:MAG: hypothetical protein H6765_04240 [Candidatus Peribacteria bacterium]|nr:MAG: hypothetical protein H6765_04240 [Candidatus Peribacteria bacterium]
MVFGKKIAQKILTLSPDAPTLQVNSDHLDELPLKPDGIAIKPLLEQIRKSTREKAGILREAAELGSLHEYLRNCKQQILNQGIQPLEDTTETIIRTHRLLTVIDLSLLLCQ